MRHNTKVFSFYFLTTGTDLSNTQVQVYIKKWQKYIGKKQNWSRISHNSDQATIWQIMAEMLKLYSQRTDILTKTPAKLV